ncbi:acyl-CoA dehydrogenase [Lampropedia aestuarii]|uniref:Acyl-CoA dehydrogenase n=1 Tax=Lampropedia aestuarii TaxID=2562762 RepID=A0A4S5BUG5_9BURK|nr:acyl-CoA dehydrogenase [Lampropedia aestuarii]THJ33486.1 acyl-CoA dehydrogenase [Lampropedia aestuarii]
MKLNYSSIRQTLDFLLYDWLAIEQLSAYPRYASHDKDTYSAVLALCERLAAEKFEPFNRLVDTQEPCLDTQHAVPELRLPDCTSQACTAYAESGMLAASHDFDVGGMQLPCVVEMAANSMVSAASIALKAYSMLTAANAGLLMVHGTETQKKVFALPQLQGRFFGTMNLSEPQAGSSLSDITTRAIADGQDHCDDPLGPRYRITGRKMWISAGEHTMGDNIIHLVLAKVPDETGALPPGTGGISLFIVPKYLVSPEGHVSAQRNDIVLAGVNHKLGYRGTTNTLLNYGEAGGAIGYRVGALGAGLHCMFHMMNEARIQVGLGATMLGYAGYLQSLDYARERPQGRPVVAGQHVQKDTRAPQVPIIEHADVKRMLIAQKSYAEGALALQLYCAKLIDVQRTGTPQEADNAKLLLEVLTPIAKSWPSEWCQEGNSLAIQVLGGYGYTRDFPVEQHWRDNRLNMIHEGTHGIQAIDLLGRKVRMQAGQALQLLLSTMRQTITAAQQQPSTQGLAADLEAAIQQLQAATDAAWSRGDALRALSNASHYLKAFGHVTLAWIWLELAVHTHTAKEASATPAFVQGKRDCARYFFAYELPLVQAWLQPVHQQETLLTDIHPQCL